MDTLVSRIVAILAKEKGFDLPVYHCYEHPVMYEMHEDVVYTELEEECDFISINDLIPENYNKVDDFPRNYYSRPTQTQLQKWLRERHDIHIKIEITNVGRYYTQIYHFEPEEKSTVLFFHSQNVSTIKFDTYEEALEYGLLEALKLI